MATSALGFIYVNFVSSFLLTAGFALLCIVAVFAILSAIIRHYQYVKRCEKIPGPPAQIPFFGSITELFVEPESVLGHFSQLLKKWGKNRVYRIWIGPSPWFLLNSAESAEVVLSSKKLIDKSKEYDFLHPWLATGLLTSTGSKWFQRRKMLTPAFHFKILEDFLSVFNEQSSILVDNLNDKIGKTVNQEFDIFPLVTLCTLDIICETAMGRSVNAQSQNDSDYVKAVYRMSKIVQARQLLPWLQLEWLFRLLPIGSEQKRCLSILHQFTDEVIRERQIQNKKRKDRHNETSNENDADKLSSKKPRLALLDLLIEASQDGQVLSDLDIREEVDTFMFEGHDTTAAAISWCLFLIGSHSKVQEQVCEEIDGLFNGSDRPVTIEDLSELKYLECCIKESLRLYPSVPFFARKLSQDISIAGNEIPSGATVAILPYFIQRDPSHFPDPESFLPERFDTANSYRRHPYAYVPFSAGPRNCIGQKFAIMEEKVVLASILRRFHIESLDKQAELALLAQLILRPRDGLRLHLTPRSPST